MSKAFKLYLQTLFFLLITNKTSRNLENTPSYNPNLPIYPSTLCLKIQVKLTFICKRSSNLQKKEHRYNNLMIKVLVM